MRHQLIGVVQHDLAEVPGHHRRRLDNLATGQLGPLAAVGVNPDRRMTRHRIDAVAAVGPMHQARRRNRQQSARVRDPLAHHRPSNLQTIVIWTQRHLVANPNLRHDQAQLSSHALANPSNPVEQVPPSGRVGQADQPVADLQLQRVHLQQVFHPLRRPLRDRRLEARGARRTQQQGQRGRRHRRRRGRGRGRLRRPIALRLRPFRSRPEHERARAERRRQRQQRNLRQGRERQQREEPRPRPQHLRTAEQLARHVASQVGLGARSRDDQAGRQRDQERRHLAHQPVADRQLRENAHRLARRHPMLEHAQIQATDDVHDRDQNPRDRVASHELAGPVHRTEEVGLAIQLVAAVGRFLLVDQPRVQVGVDRHLPPRQAIEHEPRGHLADPRRPLRDHGELNHDQDQKQDRPDNHLIPRDELAEGPDHPAGRFEPVGPPLRQDQPRAGHVQDQPRQGRRQQDRRKRAEVLRRADR